MSFSRVKCSVAMLSLLALLPSCSLLHQASPVDVKNVSPELTETVGRVEGQVARTRIYEGLASSILPDKSVETRLALYKEEYRQLEMKLDALAYDDVKKYPDYHARTLQELSRFILIKSTTSKKNIEFVVSPDLRNEFLQYAPQAQDVSQFEVLPPPLEDEALVAPLPQSESLTSTAMPSEVPPSSPLNVQKVLPEGLPYGKSLDERGKAGLDVYLKHLVTLVPVLSQQDNEKMLRTYATDIETCQTASIINTTKDVSLQYQTIEDVVKELGLQSDFVPDTLKVRKQKKELDNIIKFLGAPSQFNRSDAEGET
ncbi:MAG: hypothetical protein R3Y56_08845 [Akkermansia sp.]